MKIKRVIFLVLVAMSFNNAFALVCPASVTFLGYKDKKNHFSFAPTLDSVQGLTYELGSHTMQLKSYSFTTSVITNGNYVNCIYDDGYSYHRISFKAAGSYFAESGNWQASAFINTCQSNTSLNCKFKR